MEDTGILISEFGILIPIMTYIGTPQYELALGALFTQSAVIKVGFWFCISI